MPFVDVRLTKKIGDGEKNELKSEIGKAISIIHKPESYLMVGICDGYDLYFGGKKCENGAYIGVSVFGKATPDDCQKMTAKLCEILERLFGVDGENVYITYSDFDKWGWNGNNF